jgi:ABC-type nitrate/sulfonate/bicarbonate transport system permease component
VRARATFLQGALLPLGLLVVWQLWALGLPPRSPAPSPLGVVRALADLSANGGLLSGTAQSFGRVLGGFALAGAVAVPLGILMGAVPAIRRNLDPIIEGFRPIAAIALLPMAILWFGTGTPTAVFIVAYAAFFPLVINTIHGVSQVDRRLVAAARTMGVAEHRILLSVVLPAALPAIFVGARLAMGAAWTAIIAAELAVGAKAGGGGSGGLGSMMFTFYAYSIDLNGIVVCMIVVGLIALALDRCVRAAAAKAMPWRS